jgi:2-polyprenyl-6-methoxyphenol hydroxylase-like FAD-dependent oxidoreductase
VKTAVVSGLGPNGMLAALHLAACGYAVTGVERRTSYARSIHLSLRRSYFDDVRALDVALHEKLWAIASPIEEIHHIQLRDGTETETRTQPRLSQPDPNASVAQRLAQDPMVHVRLDELERVFFDHLSALGPRRGLRLLRGTQLTVTRPPDQDTFSAVCTPVPGSAGELEVIHAPDLIVVAEGGKSPTATLLGKKTQKLSAPKLYLSVHVEHALGPVTRRLDTQVEVPGGRQHVCFWATGHKDPRKGTWLVLEVPAVLQAGMGSQSFDRGYFARAAAPLLRVSPPPEPGTHGFSGTFRFEQQLLANPVAGSNVVFFGDAAGMGHHAPGSGLELGACDLRPLGTLVAHRSNPNALGRYAKEVVASRIALLAFGMREHYPALPGDPAPWLTHVMDVVARDPDADARLLVESWVTRGAGA